jgi:hypothetical protein
MEVEMSSFQTGVPMGFGSVRPYMALQNLDLGQVDIKELRKELQSALNEDPLITDSTNISVDIQRDGKKPHLPLIGKVQDQKEKQRAEEILTVNTRDNATISNDLKVEAGS